MTNIEEILGTYIEPDESWQSVFSRISATGALDMKTLTKVIIYLLERFDEYERHRKEDTGTTTSGYAVFDTNVGGTDSPIQEGIGGVNEEVQPDPESAGTNSDSGTQEPNPVVV